MSATFTRAPTVSAGEKVTSTQLRELALAVNDRIRSGIGDSAWRIAYWWFNLFRQVRNPAATEGMQVFPAQGEFFDIYQLLDPENNIGQWPEAGPGEYEGANVGNPMMQFVFGNPILEEEAQRIEEGSGGPPLWLSGPPQTLAEFWHLGKLQRGVIDPFSGDQQVPALAAAQNFFRIQATQYSPHGKSWGGYLPSPVVLETDCSGGDPASLYYLTRSYQLKFTNLLTGAVVTYTGTCAEGAPLATPSHVAHVAYLPFAYYVILHDGTVDRYDVAEWIEGPYTGAGVLAHTEGGQLNRALWAFAVDFRGTEAQRENDSYKIRDIAFDFQAFMTRQYQLAPNLGFTSGDGIADFYPRAELATSAPDGSLMTFQTGAAQSDYLPGFVLAGCFASAVGLLAPVTLSVRSGDTELAQLTLTPDGAGAAEAMEWLSTAVTPDPLKVVLIGNAVLAPGGAIIFEATQQVEMKPQFWDAYLVERLAATGGGDINESGVDGRGRDQTDSAGIWDDLRDYGCIVNLGAAGPRTQADWVNDNPVYDAARRLSREMVRFVRRQAFVSYTVEGGKSILRFKRWAYGLENQKADLFYGIAPSWAAMTSGKLVEGETYIVRGTSSLYASSTVVSASSTYMLASGGDVRESITYRGTEYTVGQTFVAGDDPEFASNNGAELYEYDGIRSDARKKGFSNEWVGFLQLKVYHPSESSIWKPDAYTDYFRWSDRCHFMHGYPWKDDPSHNDFKLHVNFGHYVNLLARADGSGYDRELRGEGVRAEYVAPESPTGFRYVEAANTGADEEFHSSCRVYEPPVEIESATIENPGPNEIVVLTFKTRFHSCPNAPATVDPDPATWSAAEIANLRGEAGAADPELYRTDDNALREYALSQRMPDKQGSWKDNGAAKPRGDAAWDSTVKTGADDPLTGAIFPDLILVHLIGEPYDDGNDVHNSHDSRCLIDQMLHMEIALRAGCEGFIDPASSISQTCDEAAPGLYEYTWENLCFQAFSGRGVGPFPLSVRPDNPAGYGPLPNSVMYADVFNRLSSAVNLLTRARLSLPIKTQVQTNEYESIITVGGAWPSGVCVASQVRAIYDGSAPSGSALVSSSGWSDSAFVPAGVSVAAYYAPPGTECEGDDFKFRTNRTVIDYRFTLASANALASLPPLVSGLITDGRVGRIAILDESRIIPYKWQVATSGESQDCVGGANPFWDAGLGYGYAFDAHVINEASQCALVLSGSLDGGRPPGGSFFFCRTAAAPPGNENFNVSQRSVSITSFETDDAFLDVPLVD